MAAPLNESRSGGVVRRLCLGAPRVRAWLLALVLLVLGAGAEAAYAQLSITPTTWNILGLDSNKVTVGPNVYPVGVRVCNTGGTLLNNVVATFYWDSSN